MQLNTPKILFCFFFCPKSNLSGHKNIIGYVDSSITPNGNGVCEVLLLMPYCKYHMLAMMNARLVCMIDNLFDMYYKYKKKLLLQFTGWFYRTRGFDNILWYCWSCFQIALLSNTHYTSWFEGGKHFAKRCWELCIMRLWFGNC